MYNLNAKVVLLGVGFMSVTFRHYAEYVYVDRCLKSIENHPKYNELKSALDVFNKHDAWPHVYNNWVYEQLDKKNVIKKCKCGSSELMCFESKVFVDFVLEAFESENEDVFWQCPTPGLWDINEFKMEKRSALHLP